MKRRFPRFRFTLRGGGGGQGEGGRVRLHVRYFSASVTVRASWVKETFSYVGFDSWISFDNSIQSFREGCRRMQGP